MSTAPNPNPPAMVRKRRRRQSEPTGWKAVPLAAKFLIGICLATVIGIPLGWQNGWLKKRPVDTTVTEGKSPDLILGESVYVHQTRTIKGTVLNKSANRYKDVVISYNMTDGRGAPLGVVIATVSTVGPNATAHFETDPMPKEAIDHPQLREIVGTPQ